MHYTLTGAQLPQTVPRRRPAAPHSGLLGQPEALDLLWSLLGDRLDKGPKSAMPISPPSSNMELLFRLLAATVAGGVVGLNRRFHQKAAGVRTLSLVSLGCALPAALALDVAVTPSGLEPANVARALQGILTGIGFLGAGVILHRDDEKGVHGLTTAASVWVTAGMGVSFGVGYWAGASMTCAILVVVLIFGGPFQKFLHAKNVKEPAMDIDNKPS